MPKAIADCQACGINGPITARGMCRSCYFRARATTQTRCVHLGCDKPSVARWFKIAPLCGTHRQRMQSTGSTLRKAPRVRGFCTVEGCRRRLWTEGLCDTHLYRWRQHGSIDKPTGRRTSDAGYILVKAPNGRASDGYQLEHRFVMEQTLGRRLEPWENVHHINGVRDDNRAENLELWVKPQPCGQRIEDLINWMLDAYPEAVEAAQANRAQLRLIR